MKGKRIIATVSRELEARLNGHPDRARYQRLIGEEVRILPGTERGDQRGNIFVQVVPLEGSATPLALNTKFLQFAG